MSKVQTSQQNRCAAKPKKLPAGLLADGHVKRPAARAQNHVKYRAVHTLVVPA